MQNNVVYKHKLLWQSVLTFAIYRYNTILHIAPIISDAL